LLVAGDDGVDEGVGLVVELLEAVLAVEVENKRMSRWLFIREDGTSA